MVGIGDALGGVKAVGGALIGHSAPVRAGKALSLPGRARFVDADPDGDALELPEELRGKHSAPDDEARDESSGAIAPGAREG